MNNFTIGFILVALLIIVICILYIVVKDEKQKKEIAETERDQEKKKNEQMQKQQDAYNEYRKETEEYKEKLHDSDGNFNYDSSVELLQKLRKDGEKRNSN